MKKITLIFLVLASSLIACNNDDDELGNPADKIVGTWGNYKDVYLPTNEVDNYDPYYSIDTFNLDGTATSSFDGLEIEGNWENLSDGVYKLSVFGMSANTNIEFVGNDEMIIYDNTDNSTSGDDWAYHYERIN